MSTALHQCEYKHGASDACLKQLSRVRTLLLMCCVHDVYVAATCKWLDVLKLLLHSEHLYGLSPVWTLMWVLSHTRNICSFSPVWILLCKTRSLEGYLLSCRASPLADVKLYCLVTEAHVCKQLAHGCTRQTILFAALEMSCTSDLWVLKFQYPHKPLIQTSPQTYIETHH